MLLVMLLIGLVAPLEALAAPLGGQGGTSNQTDNNFTLVIIVGLLVVLLGAGVGLLMSRRKR